MKYGFQTIWLCVISLFCLGKLPAQSQPTVPSVVPDSSAGSVVSGGQNQFVLTEGTSLVNDGYGTLIHSLETFSPESFDVVFDLRDAQNAVDTSNIQLILSRVTGGMSSSINGEISILQDANTPSPDLFLINPYGITFGASAELSLPGSFLASTANSVVLESGTLLSATGLELPPLLTISRPVGLQFSVGSLTESWAGDLTRSSGAIALQGNGHSLASTNPIFAPYLPTQAPSGLSVNSGETLGLVSTGLTFSGASIAAPGGRAELGSVLSGQAKIRWLEQGFSVDFSSVEQFDDVELTDRSLVSLGGALSGSAQLQGRQISLSGGSNIIAQNMGAGSPGQIFIRAVDELSLTGASLASGIVTGIRSETLGPNESGDLKIEANRLQVGSGASLVSRSFGDGSSGDVVIDAHQIEIDGAAAAASTVFSAVATLNARAGRSGDVRIDTRDLKITNGGYLGSTTIGSGRGGDVSVTADTIAVSGATSASIPSIISASMAGRQTASGNITLNTRLLSLQDSGLVSTSSVGVGNAGNIVVNATERIDIQSGLPNLPTSTIASTVDQPPASYRLLLGLTETPEGSSGDVRVSTPVLVIRDRASITVSNFELGDAGNLEIEADSIFLHSADINALTQNGEGGNLRLSANEILFLRNGSRLSTAARGIAGNGGNLRIQAPVILGLENSDIVASAVTGNGGNISIEAQEIFGLRFRAEETEQSDITASSQFGLSGRVAIEGFDSQSTDSLADLPTDVVNVDYRVARQCAEGNGNYFVASGRGGLSVVPGQATSSLRPWTDVRDLIVEMSDKPTSVTSQPAAVETFEASAGQVTAVEATEWGRNETGEVVLNAGDAYFSIDALNCLD
ncbi:MAG: S-layer family protein [Cyanobacteria bacterium J06650_10]